MKKVTVRKVGPVRLTSVAATMYGDPTSCPIVIA
ncbi:hypothetical protein ABH926_005085 [Catenulispora sp. GP43]